MSNHRPIADFSDLVGTSWNPGAAREALSALEYLIREFDAYGKIDEINIKHARDAAPNLRAAIQFFETARTCGMVAA